METNVKKNKYFIAIYTNLCKDYCDKEFFTRINELKKDNHVNIVDNSSGNNYLKRLFGLTKANVYKVNVPVEPKQTQFLRNVTESVSALRQDFLQKGDEDYFLIIESDVIPPVDLLDRFDKTIETLPKDWGILGGLYYQGFHDYTKTGVHKTHHALSGCTVYRRSLVEKYPFRWSVDNLGAFSDAWICYDAGQEFGIYNDHDIRCEHLHTIHGSRQSHPL